MPTLREIQTDVEAIKFLRWCEISVGERYLEMRIKGESHKIAAQAVIMALDRFIKFGGSAPSEDSIDALLCNFVGEAGVVEKRKHDSGLPWWVISLPGHLTFPFRDEPEVSKHLRDAFADDDRGREVEVFLHPANEEDNCIKIDVLTRQMDEFTNAIAERIAEMFIRFWKGERESS